MNTNLPFAIFVFLALPTFATQRPISEFKAEVFRFVRLERRSEASLRAGAAADAPGLIETYAVFSFRFSDQPSIQVLAYEGPADGKFNPAFSGYEVVKDGEWIPLSVGYCGTGASEFALPPGVDYELRIPIIRRPELYAAPQIRVLLHAKSGSFRSEPFELRK